GLDPGRAPRGVGSHRRAGGVPPQARGGPLGEGAGLSADREYRAPPREPGPRRRGDRAGRGAARRPPRASQYSVSWLGVAEPADAPAHAGADRIGALRRRRSPEAARGADGGGVRRARLLRRVPARVHGRVGPPLPGVPSYGQRRRDRPGLLALAGPRARRGGAGRRRTRGTATRQLQVPFRPGAGRRMSFPRAALLLALLASPGRADQVFVSSERGDDVRVVSTEKDAVVAVIPVGKRPR